MSINFCSIPGGGGKTNGGGAGRSFADIETSLVPKAQATQQMPSEAAAIPAQTIPNDSIQVGEAPKEKKGFVQGTKDFFRTMKKTFASIGGYTKATFKGAGQGFLAASGVFTGASIINWFKNGAAKKADKVAKLIPAKPLAIVAAAVAIGINFWKASLDVNQSRSEIDLRWKKTPIKD